MTGDLLVVSIVIVLTGIVVLTVATRAADGRLGRNRWAGIRTEATRSSDAAWKVAHQAALPLTRLSGWLVVLAGVISVPLALVFGNDDADRIATHRVVLFVTVLIPAFALMIYGAIIGIRAAKEHVAGERR